MKIRTIILEDELISANYLSMLIKDNFNNIEICALCRDVDTAHNLILTYKPHLIFMDINLNGSNSFELFNKINYENLHVIFVTGYEEYALDAFKVNAVDYITKPINLEKVSKALSKAIKLIKADVQTGTKLELKFFKPGLLLTMAKDIESIEYRDIIKLKGSGNYCEIFTKKMTTMLSRSIGFYQSKLPSEMFFRVHNSTLVNLTHIVSFIPGKDSHIILSDGIRESIAKRKRENFLSVIKNSTNIFQNLPNIK